MVLAQSPGELALATRLTPDEASSRLRWAVAAAGPTTRLMIALRPPSWKYVSSASYRMLYETRSPNLLLYSDIDSIMMGSCAPFWVNPTTSQTPVSVGAERGGGVSRWMIWVPGRTDI